MKVSKEGGEPTSPRQVQERIWPLMATEGAGEKLLV